MVRQRMNGHRHDVSNNNNNIIADKPVADHALSHGLNDFTECFSLKIIKSCPGSYNYSELRSWELAHILVLKSHKDANEHGLNIR